MPDLTLISQTISSLNGVKQIAETLIGVRDNAIIIGKVGEINSKLMDAHQLIFSIMQERTALAEKISHLEKEIVDFKGWEAEKEKYQLEVVNAAGRNREIFAYVRKEGVDPQEPPHKICATCYAHGKKSILQVEHRVPGMDIVLVCHDCGSDLYMTGAFRPEHAKRKPR